MMGKATSQNARLDSTIIDAPYFENVPTQGLYSTCEDLLWFLSVIGGHLTQGIFRLLFVGVFQKMRCQTFFFETPTLRGCKKNTLLECILQMHSKISHRFLCILACKITADWIRTNSCQFSFMANDFSFAATLMIHSIWNKNIFGNRVW
jgi:hypothetical protein